jgi:hypothetical protein
MAVNTLNLIQLGDGLSFAAEIDEQHFETVNVKLIGFGKTVQTIVLARSKVKHLAAALNAIVALDVGLPCDEEVIDDECLDRRPPSGPRR